MNSLLPFVNRFFDELEMYEDTVNGHSYKAYIHESIRTFLENESPENAFDVFRTFFDSYKISLGDEDNAFLDLIDILKEYESTAATLIDKQRDHYVHSVNVFITGLSIFAANGQYRLAFNSAVPEKEYENAYYTKNEEFFYRWGLASLFHDVGYPIEIVGNQINRFLGIITAVDGEEVKVKARISYDNFPALNHIREVTADPEAFSKAYLNAYGSAKYIDCFKPLDLMADHIHHTLGADQDEVLDALNGFVRKMGETGFIDHGYYSALIILRWYGYLIQKAEYNSQYLYWPVLDSATAILLHNWFRNVLRKDPFNLPPMSASAYPIAYLLILCDELQEWNREAHGIVTKTFTPVETVHMGINDGYLAATFISRNGYLPEGFASDKESFLRSLLNIDEVFPVGFDLDNEALSSLAPLKARMQGRIPRPLMENIEMLAIAINEKYNEKQLADHPGVPLNYANFSELPDDLKYSNLCQARRIYEKLEMVGLCLRKKGEPGSLDAIPERLVDLLAEKEHEYWMEERIASGWTLGEKNVENKTSPYLIPYSQLSEDVKDLDRATIRNIPALAYMIGMAVYEL